MKIGVISDIHGNSYALDSVLESLESEKVGQLIVLGDLIGYYCRPLAVVNRIRGWSSAVVVQGNHERMLCDVKNRLLDPGEVRRRYGSGLEIAEKQLDMKDQNYLSSLPQTQELVIDQCRIRVSHGSPSAPDGYVYPDSSSVVLNDCAAGGYDIVLIGHSHYQFAFSREGTLVVNPGSVGQARDSKGLAAYSVIDTSTCTASFRRRRYPVEELIETTKKFDPELPYLWKVLQET